jgi:hypothetical protein
MVNNLIFRAGDTATALERVQNSLGPNAYIIEIKNVGNFVEITASLDAPVAPPKKKVSKYESLLAQTHETPGPVELDQKGSNRLDSDNSKLQPLRTFLATDQHKDSEPAQQHELAFENVFINVANNEDQDSEISAPILRPQSTSEGAVDPTVPMKPVNSARSAKKTPNLRSSYPVSHELGFGDLLNLGLSGDFIKKEFSIEEFEGGISKADLIHGLIDTFYDPLEKDAFENYSNVVMLGPPGSGKSTVCAKLMHYYGAKHSSKPSVVHVTPEKLFEADRLNFHAKMFNLPFSRYHVLDNDFLFLAKRQLIEIAWDFQIPFVSFYASNSHLHSSVKPFLVLPAEINNETLQEIMRICPNIKSVILNKCDYGRFSKKNLMMLYQNRYKITVLSGDRTLNHPLNVADEDMMRGFVEYTLKL